MVTNLTYKLYFHGKVKVNHYPSLMVGNKFLQGQTSCGRDNYYYHFSHSQVCQVENSCLKFTRWRSRSPKVWKTHFGPNLRNHTYIGCLYHWHPKERLCRHGFQNLIKDCRAWNFLLYSLFVCRIISET